MDRAEALAQAWCRRQAGPCRQLGEVGRAIADRVAALGDAAVIRIAWRGDTTGAKPEEAQAVAKAILRGPRERADRERQQRALAVLEEGTRLEIERAAERGEAAQEMHRHREHVLAIGHETLEQSERGRGWPRPLDRLERDENLRLWICRYDRPLWNRLVEVRERLNARREALESRSTQAGIAGDSREERIARMRALSPTAFARLLRSDVTLVREDWPEAMEGAGETLEKFANVVRRRLGRIRNSSRPPEERQRRLAESATGEELAALCIAHHGVIRPILDARLRVQEARVEVREKILNAARTLKAHDDPLTREPMRQGLAQQLESESGRHALTRREWLRIVRDAGLA